MDSAFGIDHGYEEIEKFGAAGLLKPFQAAGSAIGRGAGGAGMKMGRAGTSNIGAAKIAGKGPGAKKVGMLGRGQQRLGAGLNRFGTGAVNRPGLTGGLAAGGGTAAVGGAGASFNNRRRQ